MPFHEFQLESAVRDSFRVRQIAGMFDLAADEPIRRTFRAELPDESDPWQIGLIVGPSASGKTTLARRAFAGAVYACDAWPSNRAVIDALDEDLSIKQITRTLTAVGFSSPPAWLRPYDQLSTGERFRCDLAQALLRAQARCGANARTHSAPSCLRACVPSCLPTIVFDEFTSVVDRTVAKVCSAAISRAVRTGSICVRFVAVTCHRDVIPWLSPDWVLDTATGRLSRQRMDPPAFCMSISRTPRSAWETFKPHHYLSGTLHRAAQCFVATVDKQVAAFVAALPFPHAIRPGWREHRVVCLPDFQGVGIGSAMSDFVAGLYASKGRPYFSTTSHPAMIAHRARSANWRMHRPPGMTGRSGASSRATCGMAATNSRGRITAGFEYVGPTRSDDARRLGVI